MRRFGMGAAVRAVGLAMTIAMAAGPARAQSTTSPPATAPQAAPLTPVAPAPATPAAPTPSPDQTPATPPPTSAPPPAGTPPTAPSTGAVTPDQPDTSISQTLDLPVHPAVTVTGQATWDEGFTTIMGSFAKLRDALARNKLAGTGHPLAVFTETDDTGFKFTAMVPIEKAPEGGPDLGSGIKLGETPGGKAMRFQHRAAYDDIDSTYEAITAYLDEKGLEAKNLFAEEYLDEVKAADDNGLEVDIYVFLK